MLADGSLFGPALRGVRDSAAAGLVLQVFALALVLGYQRSVTERLLTVLFPNWAVWIPAVCIIYTL